jgi:hypothetical protein
MSQQPQNAGTNQPSDLSQTAPTHVTDMRAQIFGNALVLFPHIVQLHSEKYKYPKFPPLRAKDIFEITIGLRDDYDKSDYTARLTYRHNMAPALHILLLGSAPKPTAQLALLDLLDTTCTMLGTDEANIIERPPGARVLHPVFYGSHEGARDVEMERARDIVIRLRETIRSVKAATEAARVVEGDVVESREASTLSTNAPSRENTVDGRSLFAPSLPTTGQTTFAQLPASTGATAWPGGSYYDSASSAAAQARIDGLLGTNARPARNIQTPLEDPQTPTRSSRTGEGGSSNTLKAGGKVYCTHWISCGECDYTQRGCRYKHEMPDEATLTTLCFRFVPQWWQDKLKADADAADAELRRVQAQTHAREEDEQARLRTQAREQDEQAARLQAVDQAWQNEEQAQEQQAQEQNLGPNRERH